MESREDQIERETRRLRAFQREVDSLCSAIINGDLPWIDIQIQIENLRHKAERSFPRKGEVFELIYESRFQRLWQQWREHAGRARLPGG